MGTGCITDNMTGVPDHILLGGAPYVIRSAPAPEPAAHILAAAPALLRTRR